MFAFGNPIVTADPRTMDILLIFAMIAIVIAMIVHWILTANFKASAVFFLLCFAGLLTVGSLLYLT